MFTKITQSDLEGKGVIGQPTVPGLSVLEMQQAVEQVVREVAIPAVNRLIEELADASAAQSIGAQMPDGEDDGNRTLQTVLEELAKADGAHARDTENPHAVTAGQTGAYSKQETEERINAKVVEIGTGDMAQAVYDPDGDGSVLHADALGTARKLGAADFDGTRDITLAQMGVPGYNLLDNTDFCAPVNQRGVSGTVTQQGYFIDRWKLVSGSVEVTDAGLVLNGTIAQVLEHAAGENVVASASAGVASYDDETGTFSVTGTGVTLAWAKLESGAVATPWQPKGHGVELAACLRFFERIGNAESPFLGNLCRVDGKNLLPLTVCFYPKRKAPSISFSAPAQYRVLQYDSIGAKIGAAPVSSFTQAESALTSSAVFFAYAPDISSSAVYALLQRQDLSDFAWIDVSADL